MNTLEDTLLKVIVRDNKNSYPFLTSQLQYLSIKKRKFTGVGVYTEFQYTRGRIKKGDKSFIISSSKRLKIDDFKYDFSYVLSVKDSLIYQLEIVTNGNEIWNGIYKSFYVI